jgi:hypothetical protein
VTLPQESTLIEINASSRCRGGASSDQVRIVGLTATCEGLHGLLLRSPKAMESTVRSSVRMQSRTERVAQPSGGKAMRPNPSQEQAAQLSEQIHLSRLRRFNMECGCSNRGCCRGFGRFRIPIQKFPQFLKVFLEWFKHAALVQGGGRM